MKSRSWNLITQTKQLPGSRALVFVHPPIDNRKIAIAQLKLILADFEFAEIEDRIEFVIGSEQEGIYYELWKIPAGAVGPDRAGEKWLPPKPNISRPFIFDYEDEIGECPTFVPRKFAELLNANPGSKAHIVVRKAKYPSGVSIKGFADGWIDEMIRKYGVDRNRIKVSYARTYESLTYAEFWFVPARQKQSGSK